MFKKLLSSILIGLLLSIPLTASAIKYKGDLETNESITLPEQGSTPANPTSGKHKFYIKDDGAPYVLDSSGLEKPFGGELGLKNRLMNGDFSIWQRGSSFAGITSNTYVADRWETIPGDSTLTVSREDFTEGQTDVPGNPQHYMRIQVTTSGTGSVEWHNRMEDVTWRAGQDITVTFWARASAEQSITVRLFQNFGSGGSAQVASSSGETITTSWSKFTISLTLPSISTKTVGTDNTHFINFNAFWSNTSLHWVDIAQTQVEPGTLATEFEDRPRALELQMCQRYYFKTYAWNTDPGSITTVNTFEWRIQGINTATHALRQTLIFSSVMRKIPSVTYYSPSTGATGNFHDYGAAIDISTSSVRLGSNSLTVETVTTSQSQVFISGHITADADF